MIEVSSLVALVVAEVMVGLLVVSGLLLLFTLLRKGRIRKAAAHLAERVKTDRVKREERLKVLLEERYQLEGTELEQTLRNMMQTEMLLYQNVINGFLKDDQLQLQQIDVDVENLVLAYQSLDIPASVSKPTQDVDTDDIVKLKEENERLSEELRVTMDTMGRMLNEYSTMFADGANADQPAASPLTEEPDAGEQADLAAAETSQEETQQAPMEQPVSQADATMETARLDEMASDLMNDMDIPDLSADELQRSAAASENASLAEDAAETDEEVSEIIDEVMEMADEMIEDTTQTDEQTKTGESMVDDLEKIDIEIPDADVDDGLMEENQAEAGSLEEEWAKLLEEDAENKQQGS
jgi:hypothetical protein